MKMIAIRRISKKLPKGTTFEVAKERDARGLIKMRLAREVKDEASAQPTPTPVAAVAVDPPPAPVVSEPTPTEEAPAADKSPLTRMPRTYRSTR